VWKSVTINNANVGFLLDPSGSGGNLGSISVIDSVFTNVAKAIVITPPSSVPGSGSTGVILENVGFSGVTSAVSDTSGNVLLSGVSSVASWVLGPTYNGTERTWNEGTYPQMMPIVSLYGETRQGLPNLPYYERAREQYTDMTASDFVNLKDEGAMGMLVWLLRPRRTVLKLIS
jgi:hypothetical protein